MSFALNSVVISVVATALAILIAVPAAYAMAFFPTERTKGTLLWISSIPSFQTTAKVSLNTRDCCISSAYLDEGSEPVLWHVGGQVVEHAALAEQGMGLDGV